MEGSSKKPRVRKQKEKATEIESPEEAQPMKQKK